MCLLEGEAESGRGPNVRNEWEERAAQRVKVEAGSGDINWWMFTAALDPIWTACPHFPSLIRLTSRARGLFTVTHPSVLSFKAVYEISIQCCKYLEADTEISSSIDYFTERSALVVLDPLRLTIQTIVSCGGVMTCERRADCFVYHQSPLQNLNWGIWKLEEGTQNFTSHNHLLSKYTKPLRVCSWGGRLLPSW